jgi:hypothetical protein
MSTPASVPDPFPLRNIPVPADVAAVDGCTCGGLEWHRTEAGWGGSGCALRSLPYEEMRSAVDAARDRLDAYVAALNARLRA